jgi:hypothetical protein
MGESDLLIISAVTRRSPSGRLQIYALLQMVRYGVYMVLRMVIFGKRTVDEVVVRAVSISEVHKVSARLL